MCLFKDYLFADLQIWTYYFTGQEVLHFQENPGRSDSHGLLSLLSEIKPFNFCRPLFRVKLLFLALLLIEYMWSLKVISVFMKSFVTFILPEAYFVFVLFFPLYSLWTLDYNRNDHNEHQGRYKEHKRNKCVTLQKNVIRSQEWTVWMKSFTFFRMQQDS